MQELERFNRLVSVVERDLIDLRNVSEQQGYFCSSGWLAGWLFGRVSGANLTVIVN